MGESKRGIALLSRRKFLVSSLILLCSSSSLKAVTVMGVQYISLSQVAKYCGMKLRTVSRAKIMNIYSTYTKIDFEVNQKDIYINGSRIWLGFPVASVGGVLHISLLDYYKNISAILFPKKPKYSLSIRHIILDPGHGGKDNGASNKRLGIYEKTLALDVANRLSRMLKKYGYKVSMTRTRDTYIPLASRYAYANRLKGDLFISLHFNATASTSVSGVETFSMTPKGQYSTSNSKMSASCNKYYNGNTYDEWNKLLCFYINMTLKGKVNAVDRGAKNARFSVLTGLTMPGVLVEGGFLTNYSEALKIKSPTYRETIAQGILGGVLKYQKTASRVARS